MTPAELARALGKARHVGREWQSLCPAHDDHDPSLSITQNSDGKLLCICRAGCSNDAVVDALKARGLWDKPQSQERRILATYPYTDGTGKPLFEVVRFAPKDFRQRRPDGVGGWLWKLDGLRRVPYRLPELVVAKGTGNGHGWRVYICEGEKDADRLREQWGVTATTNPGGAGKWRAEYNQYFAGADAVILADNDDVGRKHAADVAAQLKPVATRVRVLRIGGKDKADISDWLDDGLSQTDFEDLIEREEVPPKPNGHDKTTDDLPIRAFDEIHYDPDSDLWLIEDLLLTEEVSLIYGPPNSGKTFLALGMALAVADPNINLWFGHQIYHGNVVYLASEGGRRIDKRVAAWKNYNLYDSDQKLPFWLITEPLDLCHSDRDLGRVIAVVRRRIGEESLALLVIETVNSVLNGAEENGAEDMGALISNIRILREEFHCHVLLIHHPPQARVGARGHSSLPAAVDTEMAVSADLETKISTVSMGKQREAEKAQPFTFGLKVVHLGYNRQGSLVTSCVLDERGGGDATARRPSVDGAPSYHVSAPESTPKPEEK